MKKVNNLINIPKLTGSQEFHENTKLRNFSKNIDPQKWPSAWKNTYFKGYPRLPKVFLPSPSNQSGVIFSDVLYKRNSTREFTYHPINKQQTGDILYYSAGIKEEESINLVKRFYPSAGARYPLEVYLAALDVDGIREGVYHYHLRTHSLEVLLKTSFKRELFNNFGQSWIRSSGLLVIITAVFYRTEMKYGNRGYRHILTEVGHLSQNFYLNAAALNIGCCSIGGYKDDGINRLLDIDGLEESVVGVIAFGNLK